MTEGWCGDDYLILFADSEVTSASERYAIDRMLPGYQVIGLRGWDDLILRDSVGGLHTVPAVPADPQYLAPFVMPGGALALQADERFREKIKWYLKPLVFGGDPNSKENLIWASHEQHGQLVRWWNEQFRAIKSQASEQGAG
jgi:hypothetical protein